jgi:chromosome partitioning protein
MPSIAFHSYKGGTGKTTIASNLATMLAAKGYNVSLLDLDVYAPSLQAYFERSTDKWINDLLSENAKIDDIMLDMTPIIEEYQQAREKVGKLWIGSSNPQKEEVYKLEGGGKQTSAKIQLLRKFIQLREDLISEYNSDYIIIYTSPGIRYWSINSLTIADTLFLTLKLGDLDIEGTKKMANDIYGSFTKSGAKSYLLLNGVGGYCVPNTLIIPYNDRLEGAIVLRNMMRPILAGRYLMKCQWTSFLLFHATDLKVLSLLSKQKVIRIQAACKCMHNVVAIVCYGILCYVR